MLRYHDRVHVFLSLGELGANLLAQSLLGRSGAVSVEAGAPMLRRVCASLLQWYFQALLGPKGPLVFSCPHLSLGPLSLPQWTFSFICIWGTFCYFGFLSTGALQGFKTCRFP